MLKQDIFSHIYITNMFHRECGEAKNVSAVFIMQIKKLSHIGKLLNCPYISFSGAYCICECQAAKKIFPRCHAEQRLFSTPRFALLSMK
jgi:hypothetical protein